MKTANQMTEDVYEKKYGELTKRLENDNSETYTRWQKEVDEILKYYQCLGLGDRSCEFFDIHGATINPWHKGKSGYEVAVFKVEANDVLYSFLSNYWRSLPIVFLFNYYGYSLEIKEDTAAIHEERKTPLKRWQKLVGYSKYVVTGFTTQYIVKVEAKRKSSYHLYREDVGY